MRKKIITIAGVPGSGKSSTADTVAKELGFTRFSSGDFMRKIAKDRGVTLNELSAVAEQDGGDIDRAIDDEVRKTGRGEHIIIDSRLAFHWIPDSFKVFLDLPLEISKDRILSNLETNTFRRESEGGGTAEEIYRKISARLESEKKRYRELYAVDYTDPKNYDLVIDTNKNNLSEVVSIIVQAYTKWISEN
ncbi:MAG: cytidylate kinase family protein [bacterium]